MAPSTYRDAAVAHRRGDAALLVVGLASSVGVYFGHDWFHLDLLPALAVSAPLGDALGGFFIILFALICQRLASLAIFRDLDFGLGHSVQELQCSYDTLRKEFGDLDHMASTDTLTGCWNRNHLENVVPVEIAHQATFGQPLSLLVIDVDRFKGINDKHGHRIGDQVLKEVAGRLRSSLRGSDSITRWGGEEFVVLCPNTGLATALVLAERLRTILADKPFADVGTVTASLGAAECLVGESWQQWFDRADAALYRAKANGRNQAHAAPEHGVRPSPAQASLPRLVQLTWHATYDCGHAAIDREHQTLFAIANELVHAVMSKAPADDIDGIVDLMVREIFAHFSTEETVLAEAGFPNLDGHVQSHRQLQQRATDLQAAFNAGRLDVGEIFQFLVHDVVARHMLGDDQDFFAYVAPTTNSEAVAVP